jgi:hypothetical protein
MINTHIYYKISTYDSHCQSKDLHRIQGYEYYEEFANQLKPCGNEFIGAGTKFEWHD